MFILIDLIKEIAMNAYDASKPPAVQFGKVRAVYPLAVDLDQKLTLTANLIIVPKHISILKGDTLILLRAQGGQKWIVLGVMK